MALYHVYSQTVADGTATSVVRPSDWNSAHSQMVTLSGNTVGASTISGTNIVYQAGNNVTLSANQGVNAATIVVSGANTVAQTTQTQAAGNIAGTGFATTTTNGVVIVGTNATNGQTLAVPPYITTYVNDLTSGRAGTGTTTASTAGSDLAITLNTNGLNIGVPKYLTTAPAAQTVQPVAVSGSNGSFAFSTLTLGSSNGMHFYSTNGSIVGSYTVPTQTVDTNKAGTGMTTTTTNGTAVVGTLNTNGLSLGIPLYQTAAGAGDGNNVLGVNGNATSATTTYILSNANNVSFGLNLGTITASASYSQSVQTQPSGNIAGSGFATTTTNGSVVVGTLNSNGQTLAVPPYITTYVAQTTQTQPAGNIAGVGTTYAGTNVSATIGLNSNGLNLALSAPAPGGGGAVNFSAGTTSNNLQSVVFNDGNGVSFGLNAGTITASVNAAAGGGAAISGGTVSQNTGTVNFANSNGITFGLSNNGTMTASHNGLTQQSTQPVAVSGSNGSFAFSTLSMGNSNGLLFYTTNGSIVGSYTVPTQSVQTQAAGNIAGTGFATTTTNGSVVVGTVATNGVTLAVPPYLTTAAQSNHSHNFATTTTNGSQIVVGTANSVGATIGVPPFITTYVAQTTQTQPAGNIAGVGTTFAGTNITATMGLNSNGLALSLSGQGGGVINQTGPNIAVAGSTVTSGDVYFSNSPTVTFGMNGSTITASAAGGGGGGAVTISNFVPFQLVASNSTLSVPGQNSLYMQHFYPNVYATCSNVELYARATFVSSSNSMVAAQTITYGIYTQATGANSTVMSLAGSSTAQFSGSFNSSTACGYTIAAGGSTFTSTTNNTSIMGPVSGAFHLYLPFATSFSPNVKHAFAYLISSATTVGTAAWHLSGLYQLPVITSNFGRLAATGFQSASSTVIGDYEQGVYGTTTGAFPATYATSQMGIVVSRQKLFIQFEV